MLCHEINVVKYKMWHHEMSCHDSGKTAPCKDEVVLVITHVSKYQKKRIKMY